ncbi:hypothetical protein HC928_20645 [bacterium]|nr:hypothetical protein [bacterium]
MALGAFTFVLHSHLPYARLAGRWPHGEAWIHETACDTLIPLLQTLYDLKEDAVEYRLTLSLSPVLLEQLTDPVVLEHFEQYLDDKLAAAERDVQHFTLEGETLATSAADPHLHYMASWYRDWYASINRAYIKRFKRDIVGAFKRLQDSGHVEIITSAATHAYLPLLGEDASIRAQLKAAVASYERCFGRKPAGIWLPECGYRPGLERFLAEAGLKVFFSETHAVTGGQPVGVAAGDVLGLYGRIKRHYVIPESSARHTPRRATTTYKAYRVSGEDIAVMGRDNRTVQQVWSIDWGYPGDFDYREFNKKAGTSGLHYWRVTGAKTDLAHKDYYHPEWAAYKVDQHAEHFAHLVGDLLRDYHNDSGEFGLIASTYDTAIFGQLWFEGLNWLGKVLRHLAQNPDVELTTASAFLQSHTPQESLDLPESVLGGRRGAFRLG